jgi:hypothetical protein
MMDSIRTKLIPNRKTEKSKYKLREFGLKNHISFIISLVTILWWNVPVNAGDFQFRGPIQVRNQFPVTLPFLSFSADHVLNGKSGEWNISFFYSHTNTYVRSSGILNQLPHSDNRISFNPNNLQNNNADGQYYIDSGGGRMAINFAFNISNDFSLSLEVPIISFYGGFLDVPIENFHKLVGYPFQGRSMMSVNQTQFYISAHGERYLNGNQLNTPGIGDMVLQVKKLVLSENIHRPAIAFRLAAKLPTGDVNSLKGSGSFDFGADMILSKRIGNGLATTNLGLVIPGKWQLMPDLKTRPSFSWILIYEHPLWNSVSVIIQNQIMSSVLSPEVQADIAKTTYEWTVGSKIDISKSVRISVGVTENYINHENAPDFGMHAGVEWQL